MLFSARSAALAATVCAAMIGSAKADDLTLQSDPRTTPLDLHQSAATPLYLAESPGKPLENLLRKCGINCDDMGFKAYGFIEGSYTFDFSNPPGDFIGGRVFDIDNQKVLLNQIDLSIERVVDCAACAKENKWDVGGKVELIYGNDARFVHANGLNFYGGDAFQARPDNQLDLVQAYVDVAIPVGSGLLLRGGKFVTLLGYETINPTTVPFYSRSFLFGYAIPFTHTGVLASYSFTDKLSATGGIVRGWEQSVKDNNDSISYLGQVKYVASDKCTVYLNAITGPEQFENDSKYRTVFDVVVNYVATDNLSLGFNADFGWESAAAADGGDAQWYGADVYLAYKLCDAATLNVRGEWFNDEDGARGIGDTVYEGTVGLAIKPFPNSNYGANLLVRPEVRLDYSENGIWDGGTGFYQVTAAVDAIFTF